MNKRYGASIALVVGLLAGCSGGNPQNLVTGNGTPTSHSPVSQPPVDATVPEAARANTREGAEAFALYYFDLYNRVATAGADPEPFAHLSTATCLVCTRWVDDLRQMSIEQQRATLAPFQVTVRVSERQSENVTVIAGTLATPAYELIDQSNTVKFKIEALSESAIQTTLDWTPSGWKVHDIAREAG